MWGDAIGFVTRMGDLARAGAQAICPEGAAFRISNSGAGAFFEFGGTGEFEGFVPVVVVHVDAGAFAADPGAIAFKESGDHLSPLGQRNCFLKGGSGGGVNNVRFVRIVATRFGKL